MSNSTTIIGPTTVITGDIESDESVTIEGRVEGGVRVAGTVTVEPGGQVRADIVAFDALIGGELLGNVEAEREVRIEEGGSVYGDIHAARVVLAEGALFRGSIDMNPEASEAPARRSVRGGGPLRRRRAPVPDSARDREPLFRDEFDDDAGDEEIPPRGAVAPSELRRPRQRPFPRKKIAAKQVTSVSGRVQSDGDAGKVGRGGKKEPPEPKLRSVGKARAKMKR